MRRQGIATARVAGIVMAGCLCLMAVAQGRVTRQDPPPARSERPGIAPRRDAEEGGRWSGGPGRRELSEEDMQRIIATARDIDPDWGEALDQLRGRDPAELRQRLGMQGRRLVGLAWLRDRQPELYKSRVEDFRAQRDARRAVEAIRKAKDAGDAMAEAEAMTQAREAIARQVELDIKARAHELVAMDKAIKEAKQRLQADIDGREQRVQSMLDAAGRGEMPQFGRERDFAGPGPGGDWDQGRGLDAAWPPRPRGPGGGTLGKPKP